MIKVIDKWVIDTDGKQYICGKLASRVTKEGITEEYIKDPCYYTNLAGCVRGISRRLRMEAIKNTDGDADALLAAVRGADTRLMKALGVFDDLEVVQKKNE